MKIGYLGPPGSYSHEAAYSYTNRLTEEIDCIALPNFAAIISGIEDNSLAFGVLPVENSTHGAVATAMDELLKLNTGTVCGEVILDIEHCLLMGSNHPGKIASIYSHDQALEQCRHYLTRRYPNVKFIRCSSTSEACEQALQGDNRAAVASKAAARLYRLSVVDESIQDNIFNQTRFLIIAGKQTAPTSQDKTSIVFAFPGDHPGSLYKILKLFANHGINLTRIESRPAKNIMGEYIFYIDFLGHQLTDIGSSVLQEVRSQVDWLKVLGSYPIDSR